MKMESSSENKLSNKHKLLSLKSLRDSWNKTALLWLDDEIIIENSL